MMKTVRRREGFQKVPRREVLEALARDYHHLQNEHKRAAPESGTRRRLGDRLLLVRERFDQLLTEWVPEAELQDAWREHLRNREAAPEGPPAIRPLLFLGRSEAGAVAEIRGKQEDELEVVIDGTPAVRIAWDKGLATTVPPARFRLDRTDFEEIFSAPDDALDALADYLDTGESPPWEHAPELMADGLIDPHAALTPRGRRALALRSGA
jgi:hypothetical protein